MALGSIPLPAMEKGGYTRRFTAAVTAAASVIGPVIPPSLIMVGVWLMIANGIPARKRNVPKSAVRAEAVLTCWTMSLPDNVPHLYTLRVHCHLGLPIESPDDHLDASTRRLAVAGRLVAVLATRSQASRLPIPGPHQKRLT